MDIMRNLNVAVALVLLGFAGSVIGFEADFELVTGVDVMQLPGTVRTVFPNPGPPTAPGSFADGDRLAGTADSGGVAMYFGDGVPMFAPNEFGSLSMFFRRGSIPAGPGIIIPLMAIDYLGGPLLDLDGDAGDGVRSLIPVTGASAVLLPGTSSAIRLEPDFGAGTITLTGFDATGNNEGSPGFGPEIATLVNVLAGTTTDGMGGAAINPSVDTRAGSLAAFSGTSGMLAGVYRIENLGFEFWQDSVLDSPSTGPVLGSFQYLGTMSGWLVVRSQSGSFPVMAGEGLGSTGWPAVDVSQVGNVFAAAHGAPTATIADGTGSDVFSAAGNGGLVLGDFGGDLGAYFDSVVAASLATEKTSFVYLESAGFGINNSFDPVFGDSSSYDVVLTGASECIVLPGSAGDADGNGVLDVCDSGVGVPAASEWGMVILCLSMLIAATVVWGRRPAVAA